MKTIFAFLLSVGVTGTCFGQGVVDWMAPGTSVTAQTNTSQFYGGGSTGGGTIGDTAPASSGMIFHFELLYNANFTGSQVASPDYLTLFGGTWLDTGFTATNNPNFPGRLVPVNPNAEAVVPWDRGTTNNIMLVGWSANLGTSWLVVSNEMATQFWPFFTSEAFFGESATGYLTPNDLPAPGAVLFNNGADANGLPIYSPNMQLYELPLTIPTPEPSSFVLAGIGGLSLLLFRRRRK